MHDEKLLQVFKSVKWRNRESYSNVGNNENFDNIISDKKIETVQRQHKISAKICLCWFGLSKLLEL